MRTQQVNYLSGRYKAVTVAKAYTAQTNLTAFINNAVFGEIAIVKKSDNTIFDGATAIPVNTEVYMIKKVNDLVNGYKSLPPFTFKATGARVTNYADITTVVGASGAVPVKRVVITYGGSADCGGSVNGMADVRELYSLSVVYGSFNGVLDELNYTYSPSGNESLMTVLTKLITKTTDQASLENQGKQMRVSISAPVIVAGVSPAPSTATFTVTGLNYQEFTLGVTGFCNVAVTNLVRGTQPVNSYLDVLQMEKEGLIVDGRTIDRYSFSPMDDFTVPHYVSSDSIPTTLFTGYQIDRVNKKKAEVAGDSIHTNTYQELIFVPNSSTVATKLNTLFGL